MPDPLSSDVVVRLRSDPTAALAAALILASSFPDLVSWAMRTFITAGGKANTPARANGAGNGELKATAPREAAGADVASGGGPAAAAAKHDQALIALMRANPGASVTEIIRINRRPRNSTMASLERLERAGLVEHEGRGKWTVAGEPMKPAATPPATPPKPAGWIEPLSGARVARHAADGRVRSEMTLA